MRCFPFLKVNFKSISYILINSYVLVVYMNDVDKCVHLGNHCLQPRPTFKPPGEPPASLPQVICQSPPHFPSRQPLIIMFSLLSSSSFIFCPFSFPGNCICKFLFILASPRGRSWCLIELNPRPLQRKWVLNHRTREKSRSSQVCGFLRWFFFLMWAIFKSLYWACYSLLFHALVFWAMRAWGIFIPLPGMELALSTLEGKP